MRKYKVIGYISTKDIPTLTKKDIKALDVINIAFAYIYKDKVCWNPMNSLSMIQYAKEINPEIKVMLSVGGWSAGGFSEAASTSEGRESFASSAMELLDQYSLDGIDIDWEYPCISVAGIEASAEDKENFTLLLKKMRETLDQCDTRHYLSIAAGGDDYYIRCTQMDQVAGYVDYVQIMTYDLRGGFSMVTGHHTNLYTPVADLYHVSVEKAVKDYKLAGVPAGKLVIGVAFYSRRWDGVVNRNNGYLQASQTVGMGSYSYHELVDGYINKNSFVRYWDDEAKAPYLFNGETFISYDDTESIYHKAEFVKKNDLLGIMYWEYGCDKTHTLTGCIRKCLTNEG